MPRKTKTATKPEPVMTHCHNGHEFDEGNTYHKDGKRYCRQCRHDAQQNAKPIVQVVSGVVRHLRPVAYEVFPSHEPQTTQVGPFGSRGLQVTHYAPVAYTLDRVPVWRNDNENCVFDLLPPGLTPEGWIREEDALTQHIMRCRKLKIAPLTGIPYGRHTRTQQHTAVPA